MDQGAIVLSGHEGVYAKELNTALTSEHMYGIGSTSKTYTSATVMKLVDQGKIDLDAPVTTYLPDFKMADARYKDITIRMLLNHASGLSGSTFHNGFLMGDKDTINHDTFLKSLEKQQLNFAPGTYSVYCNDGFTLAELVVEAVSGKSFTQFLHDEITGPIGASHTKTPQDGFNRNQLAGYVMSNQIISATESVPVVTCAQMAGRDLRALNVVTQKGVEYLECADMLFVDGSTLTPFTAEAGNKIKIGSNGYTQWFTLDPARKDQTLTFEMKGKGSDTVTLPEGGYIAFAGNVGTAFTVNQ